MVNSANVGYVSSSSIKDKANIAPLEPVSIKNFPDNLVLGKNAGKVELNMVGVPGRQSSFERIVGTPYTLPFNDDPNGAVMMLAATLGDEKVTNNNFNDLKNKFLESYHHDKSDDSNLMSGMLDFQGLEGRSTDDGYKRAMYAFAAIDGVHMVTTANRHLMLQYMSENTADAAMARSNYEVMVSNILDMRETYFRTQKKVEDMSRLSEVQTYYKLYYGAKKKIIFETILVVVLLIVLHTLRRNGILPEGLFNVFFVIVLFVYIFFRLSWQIADFMSRDKRYFDKYEWGQLDGSYNFYEFKDLPSEVRYSEKEKVTKCLDKFFRNISTRPPTFSEMRTMLCSYYWMIEEDFKKGNMHYMHMQMLYVVIYETLYHRYITNANHDNNKHVWEDCSLYDHKNKCTTEKDVDELDLDTESLRVSEIVKHCNTQEDSIKESLMKYSDYKTFVDSIIPNGGFINTKDLKDKATTDAAASQNIKHITRISSNGKLCLDPHGIIRTAYYFAKLGQRVKNFLQDGGKDDEMLQYASKMYFGDEQQETPMGNDTTIIMGLYNSLSGTKSTQEQTPPYNSPVNQGEWHTLPEYPEDLAGKLQPNFNGGQVSTSDDSKSLAKLEPLDEFLIFKFILNELFIKLSSTDVLQK